MNNKKWGILGFIAVSLAIIFGGITIILSITSVISLKKYFNASEINAYNGLWRVEVTWWQIKRLMFLIT